MRINTLLSKAERWAKTSLIRVMTIAISVGIGAVYTNNQSQAIAKENFRLRKIQEIANEKVTELEIQVEKMRSNIVLLSMSFDDFPNPRWTKSADLMMLKMNKPYEEMYLDPIGKTRQDYIGKYDYDIWPEDIAYQYRLNDREVMREKRPITFEEKVINGSGDTLTVQVTKYPIILNGTVFGVRGYSRVLYK